MKIITSLLIILTFCVIGLGAFTRLSDAGLGCPDWPGCYGHLILPDIEQIQSVVPGFDADQEIKAWIEMIHRYVAGFLGFLMISLGMILFLKGRSPWLGLLLISLTLLQAALGMWTVTEKLNPIIVSLHLFGGVSLFLSLIVVLSKEFYQEYTFKPLKSYQNLLDLITAFYVLQLLLGAWVSTNYAALSCHGLFYCHSEYQLSWPNINNLFDFIGLWQSSDPLSFYSPQDKAYIQILHRGNALFLGFLIGFLYYSSKKDAPKNHYPWIELMLLLYLAQLSIGVLLILFQVPLPLAVIHNLLAALLGVPILWLKFMPAQYQYV